ncbi:hypothetical protein GCM10009777_10730 [Microbacterium pumilum]|uniref:HNH endonuclease n=1 Tax=Microbacterium pumilum TaxID=344165 RepID=A0ABP5DFA4_9MICO
MSNRRRSPVQNGYRVDFLRSRAWFARRARWFKREESLGHELVCVGCSRSASRADLELHHLDYAGVWFADGSWRAFERHSDLMPMHPLCHDVLHCLIDRDTVLARQRTRRDASLIALDRLRADLHHLTEES